MRSRQVKCWLRAELAHDNNRPLNLNWPARISLLIVLLLLLLFVFVLLDGGSGISVSSHQHAIFHLVSRDSNPPSAAARPARKEVLREPPQVRMAASID